MMENLTGREVVRFSVDLPAKTYIRLKLLSALTGESVRAFIVNSVDEGIVNIKSEKLGAENAGELFKKLKI